VIRKWVLLLMLTASLCVALAQQTPVKCLGALTESQLTELIKNFVPEARVMQYIKECGINFSLDAEIEKRLRAAGGTDIIIDIVRTKQAAAVPARIGALDPALEPTLESLRQILLSSGRLDYSYTVSNSTDRVWERISSVEADPRGCQMQVHKESSLNGRDAQNSASSYFFESIDSVEVMTLQGEHDRIRERMELPRSMTYSQPDIYTLVINGSSDYFLRFGSQALASRAAEMLRKASKICQATPVTLITTAKTPSLEDTLQFIKDKLNDNGEVKWTQSNQDPDGASVGPPATFSYLLTQAAADLSTCQIRYNLKATLDGRPLTDSRIVISLRRQKKNISVSSRQDALNRARSKGRVSISPPIYQLEFTNPIIGSFYSMLLFRDEETANRIAKAMQHAVELCGGEKEPF
jgi:hypothetical protein